MRSERFALLLKILLSVIALLMCVPFWYLILCSVYLPIALILWFQPIQRKEKIFWSLFPIGAVSLMYGLILFTIWYLEFKT